MNTLRTVALALLLAACGGAVDTDTVPVEPEWMATATSFAAAGDAPSPGSPGDPSPMEGTDEPEAAAPSAPAPSDEPEVEQPAPPPAPSPEYSDDPPASAPSPPTRDDAPAPVPGWIEGGDVCTADEQCVDGLTCAEVAVFLPDGSGYYENAGERRCGYVTP